MKKNHIENLIENYNRLKGIGLSSHYVEHEWNGYEFEDIQNLYNEVTRIFDLAISNNILSGVTLSINFFNEMNNQLGIATNNLHTFIAEEASKVAKDQAFPQIMSALDRILQALRSYNIASLSLGGQVLQNEVEKLYTLSSEAQEALEGVLELTNLSKKVLLEVNSTKISEAFAKRKVSIVKQKLLWLALVLTSVGASFLISYLIVLPFFDRFNNSSILSSSLEKKAIETIKLDQTGVEKSDPFAGAYMGIVLRISLLAPFIYLLVLGINQYNKEREYEEQYAHREAISSSIPGYHGLIEDDEIKDQLAKDASTIIFAVPQLSKEDGVNKKALQLFEKLIPIIDKRVK
ncbi:hypothetical protein [Leptospira saintgironsiae]|uniref:Uncharacterized protein n=1 Tax=Leptospira saintgironsiae TaxID=2023183 RepID=A0A2M9Y7K0_9LEPT|nr:hypothetical protein [Leptospira saintgironsiae]PJZ47489.1 hypothetical protein CH362_18860 [Leptospira saintgironsiae]